MKTLIFIVCFVLLNTYVIADLIPLQRAIAHLKPISRPKIENGNNIIVNVWVDRPDQTYFLGDSISFYVKVNIDSYLTLLDIGTTGKTHIIFPNKFNRSNFVKAGTTISVPSVINEFDFQVSGSKGNEVIKAIATTERIEIIPKVYLSSKKDNYREVVSGLGIVAKVIDETLNDKSKNIKWGEYTKILKIR